MKRSIYLSLTLLILVFGNKAFSQEGQSFGIKWSGYVKTDILYDSRQIFEIREGHFSIYPKKKIEDAEQKDINAHPNFNILSIQTRLAATITGPDVLGAKAIGYFETEFFGMNDATINTLRLRHAFLKFTWDYAELLVGQYWHPMFVVECYPGTIGFNTGAPFQPFIRSPQVRFSLNYSPVKLIFTALSQRDFQSNGPSGPSSAYIRNAPHPNLDAQAQIKLFGNSLIGAGVDYKKLAPRIVTSKNFKTDETVESLSFIAFSKIAYEDFTLKVEGVLGENLTEMIMLGGYAVKSVDSQTDKWEYTPSKVLSVWTDISYGKDIEIGVFGGYSKNLGTKDNYISYFGRGEDVDELIRVSPRLQLTFGKTKIAAEVELTQASFGTPNKNDKGKLSNIDKVLNIRTQLAFTYNF